MPPSIVEQCISTIDKGMSQKYSRCHICKVPMHRDGHETPKWCNFDKCPKTKIRFQPVQPVRIFREDNRYDF